MRIAVTNNGTTVSFRALDEGALEFLHSVGAEGWQFLGESTLVLDWRVAEQFAAQLQDDGVEFVS